MESSSWPYALMSALRSDSSRMLPSNLAMLALTSSSKSSPATGSSRSIRAFTDSARVSNAPIRRAVSEAAKSGSTSEVFSSPAATA